MRAVCEKHIIDLKLTQKTGPAPNENIAHCICQRGHSDSYGTSIKHTITTAIATSLINVVFLLSMIITSHRTAIHSLDC